MPEEKKNLFNKAIDALTDRDEKAAAAKAAAEKAAAEKAAAAKATADKVAAAKVAAQKAATDKAAFAKAGAERAASMKAAADKATAARVAAAAAPKKGIVMVRSLHIRKDHITTSAEVGGLTKDKEVTILETWTDGKNSWGKLGPDQWAAIVYNGETLIKLS